MKRPTAPSSSAAAAVATAPMASQPTKALRETNLSHFRKNHQQQKSKPNPCVLMTGVITTILMTFIYLVTSSLHRAMVQENKNELLLQKQKQQQQQQYSGGGIDAVTGTRIGHTSQGKNSNKQISFITVVLPSVVNPNGRSKRLNSITHTWGPNSHAVYVIHDPNEYIVPQVQQQEAQQVQVSVQTPVPPLDEEFQSNTNSNHSGNNSKSVGNIAFPQTLYVPPSIATVDQGVPRLQYVMEQIYHIYNPDYVFFVNDHTFVIPQHICTFLKKINTGIKNNSNHNQQQQEQFLYAGHALKPKGTNYAFNSGAAGYFLSRSTMHSILLKQQQNDPYCSNNSKSKTNRSWLQGNPGLVTANCLKESMNVDPIDTRDEKGRHLFHAYGIIRTTKGDFDSWYINKHPTLNEIWGEDEHQFQYEVKKGKECCSPNTISFHYVEYAETLALHATLQHIIDSGGSSNISDAELQKFMVSHWPTNKKDIGGYSHNLPPLSKKDIWDDLLYVVKNIAPRTNFDGCFVHL